MQRFNYGLKPVYRDMNNPYTPTMISIITARQCARINLADIVMVEQEARVIRIVTVDKVYTLYEKLRNIIYLFESRDFYLANKFLVINFDQVKDMEDGYINFKNGQSISMGKNAFSRTRAEFRRYLENYPNYMMWDEPARVAENTN